MCLHALVSCAVGAVQLHGQCRNNRIWHSPFLYVFGSCCTLLSIHPVSQAPPSLHSMVVSELGMNQETWHRAISTFRSSYYGNCGTEPPTVSDILSRASGTLTHPVHVEWYVYVLWGGDVCIDPKVGWVCVCVHMREEREQCVCVCVCVCV